MHTTQYTIHTTPYRMYCVYNIEWSVKNALSGSLLISEEFILFYPRINVKMFHFHVNMGSYVLIYEYIRIYVYIYIYIYIIL